MDRRFKIEASYIKIDWEKNLIPLFKPCLITPELANAFQPWKKSSSISAKLAFVTPKLRKIPKLDYYIHALDNVKIEIVKTEGLINTIANEIVSQNGTDRGELSEIPSSLVKNHKKWQKDKLNDDHMQKIQTHLNLNLIGRKTQLQNIAVSNLIAVVDGKPSLESEAQSFIDELNDVSKVADNIAEILSHLETYRQSQNAMFNNLKKAAYAIDENRWVRTLYVDFLFGFKTDLQFSRVEVEKTNKRKRE